LLETGEEFAQHPVQCAPVGRRERPQQALFVRYVRRERAVDHRPAFPGQTDERPAPVVRDGPAFDEARGCETVESLRDPTRGDHGRGHEVGRAQLEGATGTTQRGQEVEPPRLQAAVGHLLGEHDLGELGDAKEAAEQLERGDVEVGALPLPLLHDPVDVVAFSFEQDSSW
jgi:hypothetical protein